MRYGKPKPIRIRGRIRSYPRQNQEEYTMKASITTATYSLLLILLFAVLAGCSSAGRKISGNVATADVTPQANGAAAVSAGTDTGPENGPGSTSASENVGNASAVTGSSGQPGSAGTGDTSGSTAGSNMGGDASSETGTGIMDGDISSPGSGTGNDNQSASGSSANGSIPHVNSADNDRIRSLTSLEAAALMGNGINLGNTMEAYGRKSLGITARVTAYETFWRQPVTTREMIRSMKAAGFDTLRIPVAWTNAMNFEYGDYTIGRDYLRRVGEIIGYALEEDMFVIVNDHWDGGWWGMFGSASQETRDKAMEMYISMWRQIAEEFKDYPHRLVFESANEELGDRLNDKDIAKDSGTLSTDECYKMANKINQVFVDTVRSTGGNNTDRFLLIAGYNTDIVRTCDDRFVMPKDTAKDKLLVSVHYYTPWGYCGTTSLSKWGSEKDYAEQNDLLAKMKKFTDMGYGVVIGEYAVSLNSDGSVKNNTADFFNNFLDNCDLYGYAPMLWDCSNLFNRRKGSFIDDNIAKIFEERSLAARANMSEEEIAAAAEAAIEKAFAAARESSSSTAADAGKATAWIMFFSSDYGVTYSVGDKYDPGSSSDGIIATDIQITGEGIYTVSLDFTRTGAGYANSFAFTALGISNGETLFPGYVIIPIEVQINGQPCSLAGKPYTTSDDGICTRVNLYNEWVPKVPDGIRTVDGSPLGASATLLDPKDYPEIRTMSVTFRFVQRSSLPY